MPRLIKNSISLTLILTFEHGDPWLIFSMGRHTFIMAATQLYASSRWRTAA